MAPAGLGDDGQSRGPALLAVGAERGTGLESGVDVEEAGDLVAPVVPEVVRLAHVGPGRVNVRPGQDLRLTAPRGGQPHEPDGPGLGPRTPERRLVTQDHGVERLTVGPERLGDEAVVGGVDGARGQPSVQAQRLALLVVLVPLAAPLDVSTSTSIGSSLMVVICPPAAKVNPARGPGE